MRSIKKLLTILRDSLEKGPKAGYSNTGLYGEIGDLYTRRIIFAKEFDLLFKYVKDNKPSNSLHQEFYEGPFMQVYWWRTMNQPGGREVRVDFVNKLIGEAEEPSKKHLWVIAALAVTTLIVVSTLVYVTCR